MAGQDIKHQLAKAVAKANADRNANRATEGQHNVAMTEVYRQATIHNIAVNEVLNYAVANLDTINKELQKDYPGIRYSS